MQLAEPFVVTKNMVRCITACVHCDAKVKNTWQQVQLLPCHVLLTALTCATCVRVDDFLLNWFERPSWFSSAMQHANMSDLWMWCTCIGSPSTCCHKGFQKLIETSCVMKWVSVVFRSELIKSLSLILNWNSSNCRPCPSWVTVLPTKQQHLRTEQTKRQQ